MENQCRRKNKLIATFIRESLSRKLHHDLANYIYFTRSRLRIIPYRIHDMNLPQSQARELESMIGSLIDWSARFSNLLSAHARVERAYWVIEGFRERPGRRDTIEIDNLLRDVIDLATSIGGHRFRGHIEFDESTEQRTIQAQEDYILLIVLNVLLYVIHYHGNASDSKIVVSAPSSKTIQITINNTSLGEDSEALLNVASKDESWLNLRNENYDGCLVLAARMARQLEGDIRPIRLDDATVMEISIDKEVERESE